MSMNNVFPIWQKTGCIPAPKMEGDRVSLGLLQSMLARQVGKYETFSNELLEEIETTIQKVITDETSIDFSESEKHLCVDILSECASGVFGYTLYLPKKWLGHLRKKGE
jgi:hypothetical protein